MQAIKSSLQRRAMKGVVKPFYPYYLANRPIQRTDKVKEGDQDHLPVIDKYTGEVATSVGVACGGVIDQAFAAASAARKPMRKLTSFQRKEILLQVANALQERQNEIATAIVVENGKPIRDALAEVGRAVDTFTLAAEESVRDYGQYIPLDISARNAGIHSIVRQFPAGVVSMISPFNFPVNLVAHKIAPAIAAGCPFVLKPSDKTPVGALILGEILAKTDLPKGAFSILPCLNEDAHHFSTDPRIDVLSFTGSPGVGWKLFNATKRAKVLLELGGNAACIVEPDADIVKASQRIAWGAFYSAGQSCVSVQRVFVHDKVYDELRDRLQEDVTELNLQRGDPLSPDVFLGPMISKTDADRMNSWVQRAKEGGASVLVGGKQDGNFFDATVLEDVTPEMEVCKDEVFGPICYIERYSNFKEVIERTNSSQFGLQTGLFTRDIHKSFYAFENLDVGGVVINDIPSLRVDSQPYGGIKASGMGREGVRYAIEECSNMRVMLMKDIGTETSIE